MPLQQFTLQDRSLIVTVLKLPSEQLEDGSRLYTELEKIEQRDARLPGLNQVQIIQSLLEDIRSLKEAILELETTDPSSNGGIELYGFKRVTVDDEYTIDLARDDGMVGAIGSKTALLAKRLGELEAFLDFPWEYDAFPVLWI